MTVTYTAVNRSNSCALSTHRLIDLYPSQDAGSALGTLTLLSVKAADEIDCGMSNTPAFDFLLHVASEGKLAMFHGDSADTEPYEPDETLREHTRSILVRDFARKLLVQDGNWNNKSNFSHARKLVLFLGENPLHALKMPKGDKRLVGGYLQRYHKMVHWHPDSYNYGDMVLACCFFLQWDQIACRDESAYNAFLGYVVGLIKHAGLEGQVNFDIKSELSPEKVDTDPSKANEVHRLLSRNSFQDVAQLLFKLQMELENIE